MYKNVKHLFKNSAVIEFSLLTPIHPWTMCNYLRSGLIKTFILDFTSMVLTNEVIVYRELMYTTLTNFTVLVP